MATVLDTIGKDALYVLRAVAPTVARAVGGPFGTLAAAVVTSVLGTNPTSGASSSMTSGSISALLTASSPDDLEKLKEAEIQFKSKLAELGVQEDQLVYTDLNSARQMQVSTKSVTPSILTYSILIAGLVSFVSLLFGVIQVPRDPNQAVIFGSVLTFLFTECKSAIAFWLGGVYKDNAPDPDLDLSTLNGAAVRGSKK